MRRARGGSCRISGGPALLLLFLAMILAVPAAALAQAQVQAQDRGSHGRLIFTFDAPTAVSVAVSGQEAELSFDRPIGPGLEAAAAGLPAYLRGAAGSSDGRAVGLSLARPLTVQSFAVDNSVVVDLRPVTPQQQPEAAAPPAGPAPTAPPAAPATPAPAAAPAPAAPPAADQTAGGAPASADPEPPRVGVRGGQHDSYSRVVFDWPRRVDYTVSRDGNAVTVQFAAPGRADFSRVPVGALRTLSDISQRSEAPLAVVLTVPTNTRIQDSRVGDRVVIDIRDGAPAAEPPPPPDSAGPPAGVPVPRPAPTGPPASLPSTAVVPPGSAPPPAPPPATDPAAADPAAAARPSSPPMSAAPSPASPPGPVRPGADALELRTDMPATAPGALPAGALPVAAPGDDDLAADELARRAVIDPGVDSLAAGFRRGGDLWLVFAAAEPLDAGRLAAQGGAAFGVSEIVPAEGGVVLRFVVPGRGVRLERNSTAWTVTATDRPQAPNRGLEVAAQPDFALGARLLVRAPEARGLVRFTDPEVGDVLVVAPLPSGAGGLAAPRHLPQVELLPTALGAAIRPRADTVAVRLVEEGVEITDSGSDGLLMSSPEDLAAARAAAEAERAEAADVAASRFLEPIAWLGGAPEDFYARRYALEQRLAVASDGDRNRARLDLARFHFAQHMAPEALGLLERISENQPDIVSRPEFALLQGAAKVLSGQSDAGLEILRRPVFQESEEAALWRAVALAQQGEWEAAARNFQDGGPWLRAYQSPLLDTLVQSAAQTALERGNVVEAERLLSRLSEETGGASNRTPAVAYFRGMIAKLQDDPAEAERRFNQAAASNDRYYQVLAELELIDLWREEGRLSANQAADRLDGLKFAWRGDWLEYDIHRRFGDTLWEAGRFDDAFQSWRDTAQRFPDNDEAQELAAQIPERVADLFAPDQVGDLSPMAEYALFQQYSGMLPDGPFYDEVVERLAERLAEIDLLDRAGDLLEELVTDRLEGSRKERVGTRLAALRLLDGEPRRAITALDTTETGAEDPAAALERRLLRARALSELGRTDDAFALLANDRGQLVNAARLDIARRAQDWPRAARALTNLVGTPPAPGESLPDSRAQLVLNLAVALVLSHDRPGLTELTADFGPAMEDTAHANTFALLTRTGGDMGPLADLSTIRRQVREVDMFQDFLASYIAADEPPLTN